MKKAIIDMALFVAFVTLSVLLVLLATDTPCEPQRFLEGVAMLVIASLVCLSGKLWWLSRKQRLN